MPVVLVRRYLPYGFWALSLVGCQSPKFSFRSHPADTLAAAPSRPATQPAVAVTIPPADVRPVPALHHSGRVVRRATRPQTTGQQRSARLPSAPIILRAPRTAAAAAAARPQAPQLSKGSWMQIAAWVLGLGGIGLGVLLGGWLGLLVALVLVTVAILLGLTGSFFNGNIP